MENLDTPVGRLETKGTAARAGIGVVLDMLGSPRESGGMRLHATQIVRRWAEEFPEDRLIAVAPSWASEEFRDLEQVRVVSWPNESVIARAFGQLLFTPLVALRWRARKVVSLSPIVSVLIPRARAICFEHDWRHKLNAHEFGVAQRFYRKLWELSARHAGTVICISEKAVRETERFVPSARTTLIENGRDHARDWPPGQSGSHRVIVTFGHHNNKRPELVVSGFAGLSPDERLGVRLVVLGARGRYRDEIAGLVEELRVKDAVILPGFVDELEYQRLMSTADAVVMASSDEGFGLPISEAQYFGIPAVLTEDSGVAEIHGDGVILVRPDASSMTTGLRVALSSRGNKPGARPGASWSDTVRSIRALVTARAQRGGDSS